MAEAFLSIGEPGQSSAKEACKGAGKAVGIDLGTTHSLVAAVVQGNPVCLPDAESDDVIVPSVVAYKSDGGVVVGAAAKSAAEQFPADTLSSVKRFMGRGSQDTEATRQLTPYRFDTSKDGVVRFIVSAGPENKAKDGTKAVTAVEVSAEILRVLKQRAENQLGGELEGAVITVPAYFDDAQRQATRDAGRLAGLEVLRLLNEPTAAALAYGLDKRAQGYFAVYDLGGGTFDISVLKLEGGVFEVKATGGNSSLGGDDFDRAIAAFILQEAGVAADAGGDKRLSRQVLDVARRVKEDLTSSENVAYQLTDEKGNVSFSGTLSRSQMEELVTPILERTRISVQRALKDAGGAVVLDGVILVGGATRMPLVKGFVQDLFGLSPLADIDPDQVVALGAAIQADILAGGTRDDILLLDVVPLSLGMETMGGVVEKIIARNSTIPCGATQTFTTFADKQTGFELHVVQGERELVSECRSLARFKLTGIPPMPAGMARLNVTFMVDADGLLRVMAQEETTGKETEIEVRPSYGLSDEEVERMILDSFSHADQDVKQRLLVEQRVEAERILLAARAALTDSPELLTDEDKQAIDQAMADLESAKAGSNHTAIRHAVESLDAASKDFAGRRMNRAFEQGLRGRQVGDVENQADESASKHRRVPHTDHARHE